VVPSRTEGFCNVLVEAMTMGVPTVATAAGAIPEIAAGCVPLVPPRDPVALADALVDLHGRRFEDGHMEAARRRAADFGLDAAVAAQSQVYAMALGAAGAPTVIYIGGYGRSGSTLLELALSNHPDVVGLGEVSYFARESAVGGTCACGLVLACCPFWRQAVASTRLAPEQIPAHGTAATSLLRAAATVAGATHVVDSSKTTRHAVRRPRALARSLPVHFVHLVRSPTAVQRSAAGGTNQQRERGHVAGSSVARRWRATLGWVVANRVAGRIGRRAASQFVTYESFLADPDGTVLAILTRAGVFEPERALPVTGEPLRVGHGVGGNRLRRAGADVIIDTDRRVPEETFGLLHRLAGLPSPTETP
jgi:hypothetical protein